MPDPDLEISWGGGGRGKGGGGGALPSKFFRPHSGPKMGLLHVSVTSFLSDRLIRRTGECENCGMSPWCCPYQPAFIVPI